MRVTFGLVNFDSPIIQRLERDILPTVAHYPQGEFEIICVDNDAVPHQGLIDFLRTVTIPVKYIWNGGANLKVAAAMNQLYATASHPILVYACANHGRMFDPTWLEDLVRPLQDARIVIAGNVKRYELAQIGAGEGRGLFVQGGIHAARVNVLRKHPLSDRFPHDSSDKWICWELMRNGYGIANVPTILSLWRRPIPGQHTFKYVHGEE